MTREDCAIGLVVPTLGARPTYLRAALESIENQQTPVRVVVVTPVDSAGAVAKAISGLRAEIVTQASSGIASAIHEGWLRLTAGVEHLGWLGDDDLLRPGAFVAGVQALEQHPQASAVVGRCDVIDSEGRLLYTMASGRTAIRLLRYGHDLVMQPGSLFRRQAVEDVGGLDESLRYAMDYDLFLRVRDWGPIVYLPQTLAAFRWHADSLTASNQAASRGEAALVRRRYWRNARWEPAAERVGMAASKVLYWVAKRRVR